MKAVAYVRVSSEKQSYEHQISAITKHCNRCEDLDLDEKVFSEKESGTHKERKALTALLQYLDDNPDIENVVVFELSRLGRTSEVLRTIELLTEKKVNLQILKPHFIQTLNEKKEKNEIVNIMLGILSNLSEYELKTLKTRMKSGRGDKIINGAANGSIMQPLGYYKEEKTKLLKID